ncbi:MAG: ribonucleoside hydrolase RihC [Aerococcus sp.]|nr:ribonucleoside hydrolase RihC [Aerococcus sp.]
MAKRPIIFDTDPGIDDAIAISVALQNPDLDIRLFTSVGGNVGIEKTTNNILRLQALYDTNIPVAKGTSEPLLRNVIDAADVHGDSGMDGYDFPEPKTELLLDEPAVLAMRRTLLESDEKITILAVGPYTNVALLLKTFPEVKEHIEEIIVMGGAFTRGNIDVMTEFNIGSDPEAAQIIFNSGLPVSMVGLEIGTQATLYIDDVREVKDNSIGTEAMYNMLQVYRGNTADEQWEMYDPTALAYLCHPEWFETTKCNVVVDLDGKYTYGETVVDLKGMTGRETNVTVPTTIDREAFKTWLLGSLSEGK